MIISIGQTAVDEIDRMIDERYRSFIETFAHHSHRELVRPGQQAKDFGQQFFRKILWLYLENQPRFAGKTNTKYL
jgi:hypothetical protein